MTLEKAKKLLQKDLDDPGSVDIIDLNHAQFIGIQAIKGIQKLRKTLEPYVTALLAGETTG